MKKIRLRIKDWVIFFWLVLCLIWFAALQLTIAEWANNLILGWLVLVPFCSILWFITDALFYKARSRKEHKDQD